MIVLDKRHWKKIYDESPVGIAIAGLDGTFLMANSTFCKMIEYSEEELINKDCDELTHPEDLRPDTDMRSHIQNKKIEEYEMVKRFITKTGKIIWANFLVAGIEDERGNIIHYVCHIRLLNSNNKEENNIIIRPKVNFKDFVIDNWQWFISSCVGIGSVIIGLSVFLYVTQNTLEQQNKEIEKLHTTLERMINK